MNSDECFEAVYEQLKELACAKLKKESNAQSIQATALVHEAYLRLSGKSDGAELWDDIGHFFGAASQAMRRILIDRARQRNSIKSGGKAVRTMLDEDALGEQASDSVPPELLLALDEGLELLTKENPTAAELVQLRYFAGLTIEQAADVLGISERTANRTWTYARAWLYEKLRR